MERYQGSIKAGVHAHGSMAELLYLFVATGAVLAAHLTRDGETNLSNLRSLLYTGSC